MTNKTLSPGDQLEAHCTKCREVMNHTLVALVDDRPVRVKCNTCGGEHNYHPPREAKKVRPAATTKKPASAKAKSKAQTAEREEWEAIRADLEARQALPYSMDGKFPVDSVIQHPLFGLGKVQRILGPNKIEVLFQEGRKLLRCQ